MALVAGAIVSYVVELLQFYIPTRSSAWDDVTPNSMGAVAGFSIFELCGAAILRKLSQYEETFDGWLSPRGTAVLLLVYFGLWSGISILLQRQTRLSNWDTRCVLFVGNDASGHRAWKGQVSQLQFWNRARPENLIDRIAAGDPTQDTESGLLASYDFTTPATVPEPDEVFTRAYLDARDARTERKRRALENGWQFMAHLEQFRWRR